MAGTTVTISGADYIVPVAGQDPQWGNDLHDTVVALASAANSSSGPADLPMTSFVLANNQVAAANITSAAFDTTVVRSFILNYSIYRVTTTTEKCETGTLYGAYKSTAATWDLAQQNSGSSGVTLSITAGGQLQFVSSNFGGASYSGKMKFTAKAFLQA